MRHVFIGRQWGSGRPFSGIIYADKPVTGSVRAEEKVGTPNISNFSVGLYLTVRLVLLPGARSVFLAFGFLALSRLRLA